MKFKNKKILLSSLLGMGLMAASVAAVAVACGDKKTSSLEQNLVYPAGNNSTGYAENELLSSDTTTQGYSFRNSLTKAEHDNLEKRTKEWWNKINQPLNVLFKEGFYAKDQMSILNKSPKFATTRDSGSLEQQDAAYAFGIAPDFAHFKWGNQVVAPKYLENFYNPNKTKGLDMKGVTSSTLLTNNIGILLAVEEKVQNYKMFFEGSNPVIAGVIAQSRSGGISSKRPARILPNWLFEKTGSNNDFNPTLAKALDAHAGLPNYFTDPYEGLMLTGRMLDVFYDASKFKNVNSAKIDGKTNFTSFESFAKALTTKARNEFRKFVKSTNEWKNKDVLFVSINPQADGTPISTDFSEGSGNLANLNNIFIDQPVHAPYLYAKQDDYFTPGLGANFPKPTSDIAKVQSFVDDYGWIGGKLIATKNEEYAKVGSILGNAFKKKADKVIFTFNPYLINGYNGTPETEHLVTEFESKLTDYVNKLDDNDKFNATKMLKEKAVVNKNFFINRKDELYDASYGFLGLQTVANILNKWVKGSNESVDLGISLFNKDTVENIRAFKGK